ncbi:Protein fmp52, mitochondrial [Pseudocyphellaria aurata]|nr:Protein fmp52, mitochondrial [Pseudocyphellaria aurata]
MAEGLTSAALVGCTGLTAPRIHAIARNNLSTDSSHVKSIISKDTSTWPTSIKSIQPTPKVFISALGTTRAQAGSFEAQYAIDHDLNLSLARAAKEAGIKIYVLISSAAVSTSSPFPYSKMKAEVEEAVKSVGFEHTVIVKPGMLMGNRSESRPAEAVLMAVAKGMASVSQKWLADWWAQDVEVIGRAVVAAAIECAESKRKPGLWEVGQADIIRMGRTNWKEAK